MFRGARWRQLKVKGFLCLNPNYKNRGWIFSFRVWEKKKAPPRYATSTSLRPRGDENARLRDDGDGDVVFGVKILSLVSFDGGFDDASPNAFFSFYSSCGRLSRRARRRRDEESIVPRVASVSFPSASSSSRGWSSLRVDWRTSSCAFSHVHDDDVLETV